MTIIKDRGYNTEIEAKRRINTLKLFDKFNNNIKYNIKIEKEGKYKIYRVYKIKYN